MHLPSCQRVDRLSAVRAKTCGKTVPQPPFVKATDSSDEGTTARHYTHKRECDKHRLQRGPSTAHTPHIPYTRIRRPRFRSALHTVTPQPGATARPAPLLLYLYHKRHTAPSQTGWQTYVEGDIQRNNGHTNNDARNSQWRLLPVCRTHRTGQRAQPSDRGIRHIRRTHGKATKTVHRRRQPRQRVRRETEEHDTQQRNSHPHNMARRKKR